MPRKIAMGALMVALSLVLSYLELMLPLPVAVPGVKIGLANVCVLFMLYAYGARAALCVSVLRVLLAGFLFGSLSALLYALSGALLSLGVMALLRKSRAFSLRGVSVAGGVSHNVAQMAVAALVARTAGLLAYLPVLIVAGAAAGILNAYLARAALPALRARNP